MIKSGLSHLNNGANAVEIKRGIDTAVQQVVSTLRENAEEITSEEQLEQVATISANNDPEVGKLIATAMDKVGREGVVTIEESKSGETYLETVEGIQFDRGFKSPYFVTNNSTMSAVLDKPYILIADARFTKVKDLLPVLEGVSGTGRSLLIIAEDIDNEALATLVVNKMRGTIAVCAVKAPDFGDRRKLVLEDIATLPGGEVFSKEKGMKLDKFSWDWFGESRTVTVTKEQTTIIDGKGETGRIEARIEELQQQIEQATTPFEVEKLQERLSKFVGGVAIVHVGGNSETEMKEKKDRVDDALQATKAAIEEGIVPGGGTALLYAKSAIEGNDIGAEIVKQACSQPFTQILMNAGWDEVDGRIMADNLINTGNDVWAGFNIKTMEKVNMKEAGIIDPAKVTRTALESASSVAGTILLTECVVVEDPDSKEEVDPMAGMMGGMM
jgi:chaperonin GroEL